jgi:hypothetical protein
MATKTSDAKNGTTPVDDKKARQLSNRQLAKVRQDMKGAEKRIKRLKTERDNLRTIIHNKFLTIVKPVDETTSIRRLRRLELTEYRAKLADTKSQIVDAEAELRQYQKQYKKAVSTKHQGALSHLKLKRINDRASRKASDIAPKAQEIITEAATNGSKDVFAGIKTLYDGGNEEDAKTQLDDFLKRQKLQGYNVIVASGLVHDRFLTKMAGHVEAIEFS